MNMPASSYSSIAPGHQLWLVVMRLSEYLWQELVQKPGVFTVAEAVQVEYVRKRTLDILRNDTKLAQQVHNLAEAQLVLQTVVDEVCGYGPLTALMLDESVTEITVVGPRFAYVERNGTVEDVTCSFEDDRHMLRIIENMLRKVGRRMRNDWLIVDVRLPDGSLVNIVMPPSAVNGPTITIRKGSTKPLTMEKLVQLGTLSTEMAGFLHACVHARLNIAICGGVNAGRTTLLNALCTAIPAGERIATIEDVAELRLDHKHVVGMVAQVESPANSGHVTMRDLVHNALRIGVERIVLGECQGDEAVEMLKAMYNGYNGSLLALYANDVRNCLTRLEAMCLTTATITPLSIIRNQIATALDVVVSISRLRDGSRKILNIAEVQSIENDAIKWQSIFYYKGTQRKSAGDEVKGGFAASGFRPTFLARLEEAGIVLPKEMFVP
jgi:pilus assembly protein CpaF